MKAHGYDRIYFATMAAEAAVIIGIVSGATSLALKCVEVVKTLHDVQEKYKMADLSSRNFVSNIKMIEFAWRKLRVWCESSTGRDEAGRDYAD